MDRLNNVDQMNFFHYIIIFFSCGRLDIYLWGGDKPCIWRVLNNEPNNSNGRVRLVRRSPHESRQDSEHER